MIRPALAALAVALCALSACAPPGYVPDEVVSSRSGASPVFVAGYGPR